MVLRVQRFPVVGFPSPHLFDFERGIGELFNDILDGDFMPTLREYPAVDVAEQENELVILAELPGVRKEDLAISFHEGLLTFGGERKPAVLPEKATWLRNETSGGKFTRTLRLPCEVKPDEITAELKNGVLRVVLPKAEVVRPREIRVK